MTAPAFKWRNYSLGDLCDIQIGRTPPRAESKYWGTGHRWLSIADMDQGRDLLSTKEKITEAAIDECGSRLIPIGTLVMSFKLSIGKLGFVRAPMATNEAIAALHIRNTDSLESVYLYYALQAQNLQKDTDRAVMGATLNKAKLEQISVPLPPIDEQRRIASVLDKADAVRQKRKKALKQCEELKVSVMDCSLRESNETVTETIGALLDSGVIELHKDGNHGANYPRAEEFVGMRDGGVPFITAKSLRSDGTIDEEEVAYLGEEKAHKLTIGWLAEGDVLLAHNATVGPVGVYRGEWERALIGTSLTCFRPNMAKTSTEAIYAALSDPAFQQQLKKQMKQTTRNQVPITAQRDLTIRLPSGNALSTLAQKLAHLRKIYSKHELFLRDADLLFASLCNRAFSGRL